MANIRYIANVLNQKGAPAIFEDTAANRPAAGFTGRIFIATDTFVIQRDNGTTWDSLGGAGGITGSGAAGQVTFFSGASAVTGDNTFFWDNTNKRLGLGTVTPGVRLDIHSTNVIAQFNGTTTNNAYIDFQNAGTTQWRLGNFYNAAAHQFVLINSLLSQVITITQGGNFLLNNTTAGADGVTINTEQNLSWNQGVANESYANIFRQRNSAATTIGNGVKRSVTGDFASSFSGSTGRGAITVGAGQLSFFCNAASTVASGTDIVLTERMTLLSSGFFGIGYTNPVTMLNVSGSIFQGSNVANSNYEMFCSGNLYSPGFAFNITTVGVNTLMTRTSCAYVCTTTLTLTLPTVSGLNNQFYVIARTGATVTVQRNGTDTITDKTGTTGLTSVTVAAGTRSMFYLGGGSETIQIF